MRRIARRVGKTEAAILHEAFSKIMQEAETEDWRVALHRVEGMWADHPDAPDARQLRSEWNTRLDRLTGNDHE